MRKVFSMRYVVLICIIAIVVSAIYFTLDFTWKIAKADTVNGEKIAYLTENKYDFTNDDIVSGIDIKTYAINNIGSNVSNLTLTNQVIMNVTGNDDIVKILPESMFKKIGYTFHVGREWGFFIDCFKPYDDINILISTVVLFDLDTNKGDVVNTPHKSHLRFKFKRVLQADYAYVPSSEEKMFSIPRKVDDYLFSDSYQYDVRLTYNDNADYHIISVPVHYSTGALGGGSSVMIGQHSKYFFTNMMTALSLKNINSKNYGDDGYNRNMDNGTFISQIDYEMSGSYITPGSTVVEELGSLVGNFLLSKVKDVASSIKPIGTVIKVADTYNLIKNTVEDFHENLKSTVEVDENKLTYNAFHNNYLGQVNEYGFLIRNAVATIQTQRDDILLIGDEAFCFDYQLNGQNIAIDSRYSALFTFGFIKVTSSAMHDVKFGNVFEGTANISNNVYQYVYPEGQPYHATDYKEIPEVNAVNGAANFESHILPNYYNLIKFTPDISGYYNITGNYKDGNTSNLGISIYEIGSGVTHLNLGNTIRTSTNGVVTSVLLESGKSYYVKSHLKAGNLSDGFYYGDFSLNFNRDAKLVDIGATTIEFDSSGYSYIKLQADGNYYYTFNTSGINVAMTDENMNNITGYVEAVGVKLDNGTLQYFRIERTSNVDSIVLTVEKRRKIVYKFENGQSDESVWVINDNYPTMPTPNAKSGYRNLGWCEPGETGIHYIQSTIWSIDKADITLVADWAKTYMVHYDTRGGSSILDEEFNERWPAILSKNTKLTGYSLMGWHLSPDCKDSRIEYLPPGINTDTTVYAEWLQVDFTITFKDGGNVLRKYVVKEGITVSAPIISNIRYHNGRWKSVFGNTIASGSSYACKGYDEIFNIEWILITPYNAGTYTRNGEYTITDNGVFSQSYDNVFTFSNEVTNLYRTARITVQFTAREKDDGYQHVMLYDGASSGSTLLAERIFEHGGSKKETSPARYEFVFEIDILYLSNKSLCVRYSASGFGADTWYNSAMTCSIILYE